MFQKILKAEIWGFEVAPVRRKGEFMPGQESYGLGNDPVQFTLQPFQELRSI